MLLLLLLTTIASAKFKHHILSHQVLIPTENHVYILDDRKFDAALMRFEVLLVDFYVTWCGHWYEKL